LIASVNVIAQNPNHFIIGEEKFANTDIYSIFQDNNDVLYIGTNKGAYIYKQNKFKSISSSKQIGNSFFNFKQNKRKELFCKNLNGQIFKIENDSLKLYYQLENRLLNTHFNYYFDSQDRLIIVSKNIQRVSLDKTEILFHEDSIKTMNRHTQSGIKSNQTIKGEIFISLYKNQYNLLYKNGKLSKIKGSYFKNDAEVYYDYLNNKHYESSYLGGFKFKNNNIILDEISHKGILYYNLLNNKLLLLDKKQGASIINLKNEKVRETQTLFNDRFLSTAFQNASGTLFLGTFGEGIIIIPKINVISNKTNYHFNSLCAKPNNQVYLATQNGEVLGFSDSLLLIEKVNHKIEEIHHFPINLEYPKRKINDILYHRHIEDRVYKSIEHFNDSCIISSSYFGILLLHTCTNTNNIPFKNHKEIFIQKFKGYKIYKGRVNCLTYNFTDSTLYFSTPFGLLYKKHNRLIADTLKHKNGQSITSTSLASYNNILICGTTRNGIHFLKNKQIINKLNLSNGLNSNSIKKLLVKKDLLYILSSKGMQIWDIKSKTFLNTSINNGFVNGSSVKDFDVSDDKLWTMTKNSFSSIDIVSLYNDQRMGQLFFDSLVVNNKKQPINKKTNYTYYENKFQFNFDYRNLETKKGTSIKYTLQGLHSDWKSIPTSKNLIEYQSLPVGKYTFLAKAVFKNKTSNIFRYSFSITAPFWQRWWFYVLLVIFGGSFIYIIAKYRIAQITKKNRETFEKEELSKDLAQTKLKALRSQMNPHFIFNSLNAIQDLVLQEDTDKSYDYIVLFAQLVRNTLNYSEKEFITIEKELNFLDVYLSLEKLRFGEELIYDINYSGNTEIQIPSLIIQPFIENALLHGLLHKEGLKKLTINFILGKHLICEIIDNGVGREKSSEIKKRQNILHESFSTEAIKKRMQILSRQYNMDVHFNYEDLYTKNKASGTKVSIYIPFKIF
jgi:sensor histidine kinase YesM